MKKKRAPKPGIYKVPAHEYHSWNAVSASRLKDFADVPARCKFYMANPKNVTDDMKLGSAVHCILLEGVAAFRERFFTFEHESPRSKEAIAEKKALVEERGEEHFLSPAQYLKAFSICDAAVSDSDFRNLRESLTQTETALVWKDKKSKLVCKALIDGIAAESKFLVDLKTCPDAHQTRFFRKAWDELHHVQLAHYMEGARANGIDLDIAILIAIEKSSEPYLTGVYPLTPEFLKAGFETREELMSRYAQCAKNDEWPSYGVQDLNVPKWASTEKFNQTEMNQ